MTDRGDGTWLKAAIWPSVLAGMTMTIGGGEPLALPLPPISPGPAAAHYQLIEEGADPATSSPGAQAGPQAAAPFAELTEALMAARAKLEQLERATAALAGVAALRAELSPKPRRQPRRCTASPRYARS